MPRQIAFRSPESRAACFDWYDRQLAAMPAAYEERDVDTTAGGRTHVVTAGPASGTPLVMVHGGGGSAAVMRDLIAHYAQAGFRVFAPDIPGHLGKSEARMLALDDTAYGRWLDETMAACGLDDALVLGVSFGGFVTLKLAEHAPSRIRRAVVIVPAGISKVTMWRARAMIWARVMYTITKSVAWRERLVLPLFAPGTTPIPFGLEVGHHILQHWIYDLRPYPLFRPEQLAGLTAPVLVLAGGKDILFEPRATVERARQIIPRVTAEVMENTGHMFDIECMDAVHDRVTAFLRGDEQRAAAQG